MKAALIVSTLLVIAASQKPYSPSVVILSEAARAGDYGSQGPQEDNTNYEFSYEVQDAPTGSIFGYKASRQGDIATGYYHVLLPDGRLQTVDYVADDKGYKPSVKFQSQANVNIGTNNYDATVYEGTPTYKY